MSDIAIKVENLSKAYRIGQREQQHDTLGAVIASLAKSPLRNFKRLRNLSKFDDYNDPDIFWALRDVSFEVKHGEVLGIIGKNGAGKSTLLKILARITEPTYGRAEVYGRIASLLEVGTGFNPELTGRENIYLNGTILGMTKREIDLKLDEIIDFSGVEQFLDTPVKRYSSGMKVRLAFAVAAHLDPEILIIDEVLAVGDVEFQKKCLGKMQDVSSREGKTVFFVSHDMSAISKLCYKCLLLNRGQIEILNETKLVLDKYLNPKEKQSERFEINITSINEKKLVLFQNINEILEIKEGTFFVKILDSESNEIMLYNKKIKSILEVKSKKITIDVSILNDGMFFIQSKIWGTNYDGSNLVLTSSFHPFLIEGCGDFHKGIISPEIQIYD